ncbi:helix-turn-helix transcriptional regulator [Microbacterium sp.]|uniref:helix-turn-helix transcriptional regulator n=1 Tax=Microbacterium sp. TaxID=51671 RepID=UPI003C75C7AF
MTAHEAPAPDRSPRLDEGMPGWVWESVLALVSAPLLEVADRLSEATRAFVPHHALIVFTEDCTGRPQKKSGDPQIVERVTLVEMENVRRRLESGETVDSADIAGIRRDVVAWRARTGAVVVLCVAPDRMPEPEPARAAARGLWEVAAQHIRQQVAHAAPHHLVESRAVSSERMRITTELTERHATDLESVLAILRSPDIDDRRARTAATEIATHALVTAKTASDVAVAVSEEPVARAFHRLRADLRPLTQYGHLDVQFVEPPVDGRALPGEIAHAARSIVRSAVLAMNDQTSIDRVRVQWDCDGTNLLINVRDDGPGEMDQDAPGLRTARANAAALGGHVTLSGVPGWGSQLDVRLPLDPVRTAPPKEWDLAPREAEVLRLLAEGKRNRQIAQALSISENTVKFHVTQVYRKLGVSTRPAAVAAALAIGGSDPHESPIPLRVG